MLPQTLEPNQRGTALYKDGVFLGYENIVELSDEEINEELALKAIEARKAAILAELDSIHADIEVLGGGSPGGDIILGNDAVIQLGTLDGSPTVRSGWATQPQALIIQPKDGDTVGEIVVMPKGTHVESYYTLHNTSDLNNYGYIAYLIHDDYARFAAGKVGTGTAPIRVLFDMDIVPSTGLTQGLGDDTHWWKHAKALSHNLLVSLNATYSVSGVVVDDITAGENLVLGDACYIKNDGKAWKSDADAATTMPVSMIAAATIAADAEGQFLLQGFMFKSGLGLTAGGILYASVTPGGISNTAPVGSGERVQVVGVAITTEIIHFNPSYELVEIS